MKIYNLLISLVENSTILDYWILIKKVAAVNQNITLYSALDVYICLALSSSLQKIYTAHTVGVNSLNVYS